ncbi:putative Platelet-activating factor acetylhydrolase IB subunit alpha2 [Nannochloris sp. 'desiccata']|nr:putative Platelet-activating factor acetylhydrolase IB subunit alpha2 [Chlorella desiccata (nom. nud.)]
MRTQAVLVVLLAWHAAVVIGYSSLNDAESTFNFTEPPLSPELAPSHVLQLSPSIAKSEGPIPPDYLPKPPDGVSPPPTSQGPIPPDYLPKPPDGVSPSPTFQDPIPPDYLPKPPDGVSPTNIGGGYKIPSPPPPRPVPPVNLNLPKWVKKVKGDFFLREYRRNLALLSALDQKMVQADVLVYGDSITALNKPTNLSTGLKGSRVPFTRNFGDLNAEPLGIPADRIGNLMWRLAVGRELPTFKHPKVVVIFIGVNDLRDRTSTKEISIRMEFLLTWIKKNMPKTKLVLQALLPGLSQAEEVNQSYATLARKFRIKFSWCGTDINKRNRKQYMADRLHPNMNGQNLWLKCLRKDVVQPILDNTRKNKNKMKRGVGVGGSSSRSLLQAPPTTISNLPGLPKWVIGRNSSMFIREYDRNMAAIERIDKKGQRMDIALYGDSITFWNKPGTLSKVPGSRAVWNTTFGDLNAEPLGIPGDRVGTIIYRIAILKERPVFADPRVCIIFAGINDVVHNSTDPDIPTRMEYLIRLIKKEMPKSKIVIQALLPSLTRAPAVNEGYKKIARKNNIVFSTCGQDIRRGDRKYMADILHPNENGQRKVLRCLNKLVRPMLVE